jgi:hypothetical protein
MVLIIHMPSSAKELKLLRRRVAIRRILFMG